MFPGHFGAAHPRVLRGAFFVCHQESGFGQCIDAEGLVYALREASFGVPDSSSHRLMRFFFTEMRLSEIRRDVYGGNIRFQCKVVMRERSKTVIEVVSSPWIHQVSNLCAESCLTIWL